MSFGGGFGGGGGGFGGGGAAAGGYGMSGMSGLDAGMDGIGALLYPIVQVVAYGAAGVVWCIGKLVIVTVSAMVDVKEDATLWELLKEQPKETLLAAFVTAFCIGAPLYATWYVAGKGEREEAAKDVRRRIAHAERKKEEEEKEVAEKSAKDAAMHAAIEAEAEASAEAYRSRNEAFASRQPAKPLGGLTGICTTTIASAAQPKLDAPSNEEFQQSLHVDKDENNGGCDASRETVASFQQGRRWPATSLALALSEDGATIFAGEGGTRACGTRAYTNTASYSHAWPEWKDPASAEAGGRSIAIVAHAEEQGAKKKKKKNKNKPTDAFSGHTGGVCALVLSADGCTLYSASADHSIKAWDLASGKCTATFGVRGNDDDDDDEVHVVGAPHTQSVNALTLSADGQTLFSAGHDGRILAWSLPAGRLISTYNWTVDKQGGSNAATPGYFFGSLLASVDGQRLYAWGQSPRTEPSSSGGARGSLTVFLVPGIGNGNCGLYPRSTIGNGNWTTQSETDFGLVQCDRFHTTTTTTSDVVLNQVPIVSALAESRPNGAVLYAGIGADIARVPVETADYYEEWATRRHEEKARLGERYNLYTTRYRPGGRTWAGAQWLPEAHSSSSSSSGDDATICALVVSLDGGTLFSASADHSIKAWSLPASEGVDTPPSCTATFTGHSSPVRALQLSPDGKTLVSAAHDAHKGELVLKVWA